MPAPHRRGSSQFTSVSSRVCVCPTSGGQDIAVGAPIAVRVDKKEHIDAFKDYQYRIEAIEENHSAYLATGKISASDGVWRLVD